MLLPLLLAASAAPLSSSCACCCHCCLLLLQFVSLAVVRAVVTAACYLCSFSLYQLCVLLPLLLAASTVSVSSNCACCCRCCSLPLQFPSLAAVNAVSTQQFSSLAVVCAVAAAFVAPLLGCVCCSFCFLSHQLALLPPLLLLTGVWAATSWFHYYHYYYYYYYYYYYNNLYYYYYYYYYCYYYILYYDYNAISLLLCPSLLSGWVGLDWRHHSGGPFLSACTRSELLFSTFVSQVGGSLSQGP